LPPAAVPADLPRLLRHQNVSPCAPPPDGDGWLHEIKHDGHRLLVIAAGNERQLVSRKGRDRSRLFPRPVRGAHRAAPLVFDGEIAVPDDKGVTHPIEEVSRKEPVKFTLCKEREYCPEVEITDQGVRIGAPVRLSHGEWNQLVRLVKSGVICEV
jgi:hypothetical protein